MSRFSDNYLIEYHVIVFIFNSLVILKDFLMINNTIFLEK
ncbi:hypothetical protein HMPREF0519_2424 [Lentilactobacillus hilgardii DSM 20176 = ATCC 8290]|uniref:Uncharacterized protein n=1 Tax=Lentilactobacillus hilgardii (strain ATCC 8290 / DSM 20176 / CCUG 30140 / JCM 1155 / KCTC 3500 / NBRC 15886 / NCIMB 8040 / NRRL B-1843 / 9) TaxID=1423757 RepID=C0XMG3_LENH9|nr:hypothetical protein HMPREF0519_2424 [Lentilactobacillus hilgardii DSM 20176 = ATCC 8290]